MFVLSEVNHLTLLSDHTIVVSQTTCTSYHCFVRFDTNVKKLATTGWERIGFADVVEITYGKQPCLAVSYL